MKSSNTMRYVLLSVFFFFLSFFSSADLHSSFHYPFEKKLLDAKPTGFYFIFTLLAHQSKAKQSNEYDRLKQINKMKDKIKIVITVKRLEF